MPLLDMPLEALLRYEGRNPRPADFDAYWDRALAELDALDANVTLTPHALDAPFAECFDLTFTGVGGARVYAKYLRPKNPTGGPHPAVVMFHGYSGSSGDWADKLNYVARGFAVAAMDCRGQGGKSEDVGGVQATRCAGILFAVWTTRTPTGFTIAPSTSTPRSSRASSWRCPKSMPPASARWAAHRAAA